MQIFICGVEIDLLVNSKYFFLSFSKKTSGVLDNSALKNRIHLSKKRKHRPPGKRKNGEK